MAKFLKSKGVGFDEGELVVAGDRKTDGADAGIEIEDAISGDIGLDGAEGKLIDGEVNLEKTVR